MIKNKILLIICLGMATQSLCSTKSTEQPNNTKNNTSSWTRSPWLWAGVGIAGTLAGWVYKKYQDYLKQENKAPTLGVVSEQKTKMPQKVAKDHWENVKDLIKYREKKDDKKDLYNFISDKYDHYLQNRMPDKNFFEKTTAELQIRKKRNPLNDKNSDFISKFNIMLSNKNNNLYEEKFKELKKLLKEKKLYFNVQLVMNKPDNKKKELLEKIALDFKEVEKKAQDLAKINNNEQDSNLKYFFEKLLLYYKPIQTLKNREKHIENIEKINQTLMTRDNQNQPDIANTLNVGTNKKVSTAEEIGLNLNEKSYIKRLPDLN